MNFVKHYLPLFVILFLLITGCSSTGQDQYDEINIVLEVEPEHPVVGPSSLTLKMTTNCCDGYGTYWRA